MMYVVCYSGGHSSALVAVEAVRRYGKENVILLNHDISPLVEGKDIKRFKKEVSEYLGVEITYANMDGWDSTPPLDVCIKKAAFKTGHDTVLCTYNLKTKPFYKWLKQNYPASKDKPCGEITLLYGFDPNEDGRIKRRSEHLSSLGYLSDYPLSTWERTITSIEEIGIDRPVTYEIWKHANCIGCLKAGKQHWYAVYCLRSDIFKRAMEAEDLIGYSIIKGTYMRELVPLFRSMRKAGIIPSDKMKFQTFWALVKKALREQDDDISCEE